MSKLAALQGEFLNLLQQDRLDHFADHIQGSATLASGQRLAIYQGSVTECLASSLRETYAVCEKLVGEDFFNGLAYTYVKQTPSHSADLGEYGATFADFIEGFPAAQSLPYLADICRFCWHYHGVCRSEVEPPFDLQAFATLSEEEQAQVVWSLPQSSRLLASPYPLKAIWDLCQGDSERQEIDLDQGGIKLLLWRNAEDVFLEPLNEAQWQLANHLKRGVSLQQLEQLPEAEVLNIPGLFPHFLTKGWLRV